MSRRLGIAPCTSNWEARPPGAKIRPQVPSSDQTFVHSANFFVSDSHLLRARFSISRCAAAISMLVKTTCTNSGDKSEVHTALSCCPRVAVSVVPWRRACGLHNNKRGRSAHLPPTRGRLAGRLRPPWRRARSNLVCFSNSYRRRHCLSRLDLSILETVTLTFAL